MVEIMENLKWYKNNDQQLPFIGGEMPRFVVIHGEEAMEHNLPDAFPEQKLENCWCIYETDGTAPIHLVGYNSGEPEDQLLLRDWDWIVRELNEK